ncbi:MAG: hypothetical protein BWK79_11825 [Beggiatoa sp. IS2]|nr:MAG: hypothetical protein BWK79_11825 [Beggiatoa sp. IS2]
MASAEAEFTPATALPTSEFLEERQQLIQEKQNTLTRYYVDTQAQKYAFPQKLETLKTLDVTDKVLEQAAIDKDAANIEIENARLEFQAAESALNEQRDILKTQQDALETLQKIPTTSENVAEQQQRIDELKKQLPLYEKAAMLEQDHLKILRDKMAVAQDHLEIAVKWYTEVQKIYQTRQQQDIANRTQQKQQNYLAKAADLRKEMEKETAQSAKRHLLEAQIQEADEMAQQEVRQLKLESINAQLNQVQAMEKSRVSEDEINEVRTLIEEITTLDTLLTKKLSVLKLQQVVIESRSKNLKGDDLKYNIEEKKVLEKVTEVLQKQLSNLPTNAQYLLESLENTYRENLRQSLLSTRELPKNTSDWQVLLREISILPNLFFQQSQNMFLGFKQAFLHTQSQRWLVINLCILLWLGFFLWIRWLLTRIFNRLQTTQKRSFGANVLFVNLRLLYLNTLSVAITGVLLVLIWLTQPTTLNRVFAIILLLCWLGMKFPINLAWLLFSDRHLLKIRRRSKLYRQIRWLTVFMGILTVITALIHVLSNTPTDSGIPLISPTARDLIDSVFMLFLSLVIFPIMRIRYAVLILLEKRLIGYWSLVIRLISLLFPLAFLTVAVLGVIGYINLGWYVAKHLSLFLLVFTSWLIARGLLNDVIVFLKNFAMKHSNYGLLWTQDIIPLLDKLLTILLLILAAMEFLWISGWYDNTIIQESITQILNYPLFNVSGTDITLFAVFVSIFTLWAVFWLGGWARQVTYRWIYVNIMDLGARHALSVFTQYAVVLVGLIITLQLIGIDLTTLTVFAGALGVGIGFGLQTIANNFISGILLLIERPLRTGDYVNIRGEYEGEVISIGIRSLTIEAWNHQEIIVPNSEVISNAFTNWTLSNKEMRTTVYVGIDYETNPHQVVEVLTAAIKEIPEVLKEPLPLVTLWEFADSWMLFRVDYFVLLKSESRILSKVRSKVLLKIWDSLKGSGIDIAYPRRDLFILSRSLSPETRTNNSEMSDFSAAIQPSSTIG